MKKLILLALTALVMVGCNNDKPIKTDNDSTYYVFVIDSCEYISGLSGALAHKGNCRYCEARRKQELKELVEQIKKGE